MSYRPTYRLQNVKQPFPAYDRGGWIEYGNWLHPSSIYHETIFLSIPGRSQTINFAPRAMPKSWIHACRSDEKLKTIRQIIIVGPTGSRDYAWLP